MSHPRVFYHYTPICDVEGCDHPATHKVAAPWTDGTQKELRNYGVYCPFHAEGKLENARDRASRVKLGPREQVGAMRLFELIEGRRDAELIPVA